MPSVYIKTYGCQMNERDSEAVAAQLVVKGYDLASSEATADVILLNTCSVRDSAEQKALGKMQNLIAETRRNRPEVVLGFLGCMAQSRGQTLIDQLPDVDLVIGTQKIHRTGDYLDQLLAGRRGKVCDVGEEADSQFAIKEHLLNGNSPTRSVSAFVSIMQGCNQHCAFCIVPQTRGPERSRSSEAIVSECEDLAARGIKEVTLLGQIVTSYGKQRMRARDGKSPFVQLLEAVHALEGLERIRFTSPHPKGYGDDLVEAYGRLSKLVESAHLPVQSGSNHVLKQMRRGYSRERFLGLVEKLRRVQPGIGISTDLIVGFPGETEADFEETLSLVSEVEFDHAYVFKYSPRQDTSAVALPGQLEQELKEERHARLLDRVNRVGGAKYARLVGQHLQVLVEGPSKKNPARLTGRTRCNKIVLFEGPDRLRGGLIEVRIVAQGTFTLYGEPVEAS